MNIETKSTGALVDELISTCMKCWFAQEDLMKETDPVKVAEAAKRAQQTNARRNALIRALDARFGDEGISQLTKSYS